MDASYIPITEARGFTTHWIKTGNEIAAWFQNTPYFMKCFLLIKKCMKTIHTDNGINGFILHLQVPHIPLNTFDMRMTTKSFSGLFKHIHAVINTSNMCIFQRAPFVFRKYSSSNRNIKKIS